MEVTELIKRVSELNSDIHKYITDTKHWLFYWIESKEVQDFIKAYPKEYEDMVHLSVEYLDVSTMVKIIFDEHPHEVESIQRYAVLPTFRDTVKERWLKWNGKVKEIQIKEKEKELAYHKQKAIEAEKEIEKLKML